MSKTLKPFKQSTVLIASETILFRNTENTATSVKIHPPVLGQFFTKSAIVLQVVHHSNTHCVVRNMRMLEAN